LFKISSLCRICNQLLKRNNLFRRPGTHSTSSQDRVLEEVEGLEVLSGKFSKHPCHQSPKEARVEKWRTEGIGAVLGRRRGLDHVHVVEATSIRRNAVTGLMTNLAIEKSEIVHATVHATVLVIVPANAMPSRGASVQERDPAPVIEQAGLALAHVFVPALTRR